MLDVVSMGEVQDKYFTLIHKQIICLMNVHFTIPKYQKKKKTIIFVTHQVSFYEQNNTKKNTQSKAVKTFNF